MFTIILPENYTTTAWKNGGGVTHEIAKLEENGQWLWRLSIAEVSTNGPFSRFEGLSRILTVIEGAGLLLNLPDAVLKALPFHPIAFSGDTTLDSQMIDGPIKDLNLIYDASKFRAQVEVLDGPCRHGAGVGQVGVLCLSGVVQVDGKPVPRMGFAFGDTGEFVLAIGAKCAVIRLQNRSQTA